MELFWSVFSRIWTEHGVFWRRSKSLYSVQIQENTDQKNSVFGQFLRSGWLHGKNIFYYITGLNVSWMKFFIWMGNNVNSRYSDYCGFDESTNFKMCDVIIEITLHQKCQGLFFKKVAGLRPSTLLKKDSGTGVFLLILRNFYSIAASAFL